MSTRALPLAKALAARGHHITVLIPPWDDPDRANQRWVEDGVMVVNLPLPPRLPLLFHLWLTGRLVIQALALRPDVVHFFKPKAYAGLAHVALWVLKRALRLPTKLVVDSDDWEQAWNERLPYSERQKRFFVWQEKWGLSHADAITVASRALEELVAACAAGHQPHIFYLPNGSRPDLQPGSTANAAGVRARWQLGDAPVVLLYSRFVEFRPERVVTLVQEVASRLPQARWLVVGRGLANEEQVLQALLDQVGLSQYVHFAGWAPPGELPAYFAAANVAIHLYDDTLLNRTKCSMKLVDLLSAAVPVVADAIGQNCEYIQHSLSGILVPAENDHALAGALVLLLQEPQTQQQLGQAAARRIQSHFTWPTLSQAAERAYNS
jgi:glycosyltransferase involved in cell wall biosynthesis